MMQGADQWADAPLLAVGDTSDPTANTALTTEGWEYAPGDGLTAWWKVVVDSAATYVLDTDLMSASGDLTIISVYRDVDGTPANMEAILYGERSPFEAVDLTPGQTYYVQVDTYDGPGQEYVLRLRLGIVGEYQPGFSVEVSQTELGATFPVDESGAGVATAFLGHSNYIRHGYLNADPQVAWDYLTGRANFDFPSSDFNRTDSILTGNVLWPLPDSSTTEFEWYTGPVYTISVQSRAGQESLWHPSTSWPADAVAVQHQSQGVTYQYLRTRATATGIVGGSSWNAYTSALNAPPPSHDKQWPSSLNTTRQAPIGGSYTIPEAVAPGFHYVVVAPNEVFNITPPPAPLHSELNGINLTIEYAYTTPAYRYVMVAPEVTITLTPNLAGTLGLVTREFD